MDAGSQPTHAGTPRYDCRFRPSRCATSNGTNQNISPRFSPRRTEHLGSYDNGKCTADLAGGFGGAARALGDLMLGLAREELSDAWATEKIKDYDAAVALYHQHGGEFRSVQQMQADIVALTNAGIAAALNNGLDEIENRELLRSTDAQRIAQLVLRGLGRI